MKAEYINHMGDDLTVVNAARVSFEKESDWEYSSPKMDKAYETKLRLQDTKLIRYLSRHGHWTPFGHPQVILRETVPIFVARQRFKHTVGFVYNEVSRRYVDSEPEFYTPSEWRGRAENKKQGSSDEVINLKEYPFEFWDYDDDSSKVNLNDAVNYHHEISLNLYKHLLHVGVAPEQARMVLPQSMYTSYYVTGSLAAWARAYNLRTDSHAQQEIQDLAKSWHDIISPLFPVSWEALTSKEINNA